MYGRSTGFVQCETVNIASLWLTLITGSIARSARRRYLIYPESDFEVFRPKGRHVAPLGVKFGMEEGTEGPSMPNFTPIGATVKA